MEGNKFNEELIEETNKVETDVSKMAKNPKPEEVVDYLDEYDNYYLDHEKYLQAGHGGKQRNKLEVALNTNKHDPSGNVRIIVSKMQNFEQNRRKSHSS